MDSLLQEIRHSVRSLVQSPCFTSVAVLTLALGIGTATAIFSVVDAVILRPLPYADPDRLVRIYTTDPRASDGEVLDSWSGADFLDLRARSDSLEGIAGFSTGSVNLVGAGFPLRIRGTSVTPDFFAVMGVDAALGRGLSPEIDRPGAARAVVLGHGLWRSHFGGDPSILGRSLKIEAVPYSVVGVMPPGFDYPGETQLWTASGYRVPDPPFPMRNPGENRHSEYFHAVGRMRPGLSVRETQAEMDALAAQLARDYPETNAGEGIAVVSLHESIVHNARPLLYALFGAVGVLLLISCTNVANLLLVRSSRRAREIAIRVALGAGRSQIVRQFLIESTLLALGACLPGLLLALWGTEALVALAPQGTPRLNEVGMDLRVLGFSLLVALSTGILFGIAPALQMSARAPQTKLKEEGTSHTSGRSGRRLQNALIAGEVAVSVLLLVGAGLMVRTFVTLLQVDPGFRTEKTLAAHVLIPSTRYDEDHEVAAFYRRALEKVQDLPGVVSAGAVLTLPMHWSIRGALRIAIEGRPVERGKELTPGFQLVGGEYFRTLSIPLLQGRFFTEADDAGAPLVAIVNRALADLYWPGEEAVGRRVTWDDPQDENVKWVTIVGIVGNTVHDGLDEPVRPEIFRPYGQDPLPLMTFVVRSEQDPAELTAAVRKAVASVDPEQPISGVVTMDDVVATSLDQRRFNMVILGTFALGALALSGIGLYGVLSFAVSQRSREIGIRKALGARPEDVIRQIIYEGIRLTIAGVALGAPLALLLANLIAGLIHGVGSADPLSYAIAFTCLTAVALLASYIPARRASRVDPALILRGE